MAKPVYLSRRLVLESDTVSDIQEKYGKLSPTSRLFAVDKRLVQAKLCTAQCGPAVLSYTEVIGALGNCGTAPSRHVVFGCSIKGVVRTFFDEMEQTIKAGESCLILPGDNVLHVIDGAHSFTLRLLAANELMLWLKARPHAELKRIPRLLETGDSNDLIRLIEFFSLEFDRHGMRAEESDQIQVMGPAIVQRATKQLEKMCGFAARAEPKLLQICLDVDEAIREADPRPLAAPDMAALASCSVRQLYRAFEIVAETTPIDYQLRLRLVGARAEVSVPRAERKALAEIAQSRGFQSVSRFRSCYREEFGERPEDTAERRDELFAGLFGKTADSRFAKG